MGLRQFQCGRCEKETKYLVKVGQEYLCIPCSEPVKQKRKKEWKEFSKSQDKVIEENKPKPKQVDLNPGKYPVRDWIKKHIEENNGVTFNSLTTMMMERGYGQGTINSQIKRVRRDFEVDGNSILAAKEAVKK